MNEYQYPHFKFRANMTTFNIIDMSGIQIRTIQDQAQQDGAQSSLQLRPVEGNCQNTTQPPLQFSASIINEEGVEQVITDESTTVVQTLELLQHPETIIKYEEDPLPEQIETQPDHTLIHTARKSQVGGDRKTFLPRKPCPECKKELTNVNEHMKSVHWQVKNYQCELCSYCSSFKNDLMKHTVSKHTERIGEQKPIKTEGKVKGSKAKNCEECGKLVVNMNEHIRYVHRKEKNFACGQCEYKTLFKSDLIKHQNAVHHGIRKICPHCGKHASNLSEHIRFVHARTKNYKCNVCAYACVKPADLRKHISAVHKGSLIT
ncbi:zinc finger protein 225 [Eurytemora carolleeae]|uniref:zinc finger protein 225 n=1 Tax=Eurytemora carolleeae TaxID=1294199 RepID=UPI000C757183|nr:zinc finger protein 225 [Eurytemora carolleeae]|eukprot:XP_023345473.1 zinc finger protein 225-like [Eurytemora affinis]